MQDPTSSLCQCANCPGAGCNCGCASATPSLGDRPQALPCTCAGQCGCEAGETGCVCH